jgi:hypothetical protein
VLQRASEDNLTIKRLPIVLILAAICLSPCLALGDPGKCIEGDCKNGRGTMLYPDNCIYQGEWKNGVFDGRGTFTLSGSWKYDGEWKDGERHGWGSMSYPGGAKYVGEWKEGERHGKGFEKNSLGIEMEGYWVNGIYGGKIKPVELSGK